MRDEKGYEEYRRIMKKIENEGYVQWKKQRIEEVKGLEDTVLINTVKRYEIQLEYVKWDVGEQKNPIISRVFPMLTIIATIFVALYTGISNGLSPIFSFNNGDIETLHSLMENYVEALLRIARLLIIILCNIFLGVVIVDGIYEISLKSYRGGKVYKIEYYKDMIKILRKEINIRNLEGE